MANLASDHPVKPVAQAAEQAVQAAVAPSWVSRNRARLFQVYGLLALASFSVLGFFAHSVNYFPVDLQITLAIQSINNSVFDFVMRMLTELGNAPWVYVFWLLPVVLLFVAGLRWESVMTMVSVIGVSLLSLVTKLLVGRPRPLSSIVHVFSASSDFSFPSGHVLFYIGFVGFLWFLCFTILKRGWRRTLALWMLGAMLALIGLSRIYVGAHWASDVFGSYLLGSAWLWTAIELYRWGKPRFFVNQPVAADTSKAAG
jgi:membrane-associated phospholipid phosphatase